MDGVQKLLNVFVNFYFSSYIQTFASNLVLSIRVMSIARFVYGASGSYQRHTALANNTNKLWLSNMVNKLSDTCFANEKDILLWMQKTKPHVPQVRGPDATVGSED